MGFLKNMFGGGAMAKASKKASKAQIAAMEKGIGQQEKTFDYLKGIFQPYQQFGQQAMGQYGNLVGMGGGEAQQLAIDQLRNSPFYQSLYRAGEEATLQNASATGGLRGGNTQGSLYELGEDTLARTIDRQLGYLGAPMEMGYGATGQVGGYGSQMGQNITDLLVGQGQAKAQDILTRGALKNQMWSGLGGLALGIGGAAFGLPGFGSFGAGGLGGLGKMFGMGGGGGGGGGLAGGMNYNLPQNPAAFDLSQMG